jgi:hypothetical protein
MGLFFAEADHGHDKHWPFASVHELNFETGRAVHTVQSYDAVWNPANCSEVARQPDNKMASRM